MKKKLDRFALINIFQACQKIKVSLALGLKIRHTSHIIFFVT
jgi:hypothetical protein